jgi:hypothetical protein
MSRWVRSTLRRRVGLLFDQQLWCWGRDISRSQGNILLQLGMSRYRAIDSSQEGSAYTARVPGEGLFWLWGFGLLYSATGLGNLFLQRMPFEYFLLEQLPSRPVHHLSELTGLVRPNTARQRALIVPLMEAAFQWMGKYEHWIAETLGADYRARTLAIRGRAAEIPAQDQARTWDHLAKKVHRLVTASPEQTGHWSPVLHSLRRSIGESQRVTKSRRRPDTPRNRLL